MSDAAAATAHTVAPGEVMVRRALLSVSDKRGLSDFARGLSELGIELVSTGGTARALERDGLPVRQVSDLTGFPEIMDGRVKTLHPKLHAALLAVRSDPDHMAAAAEHEVEWIDLVCVNLYPFEATIARRGASDAEVIEQIDIGGPSMIRAAAKNAEFTAPVTSPEAYDAVLAELQESGGRLSLASRASLAASAFAYTARYETSIARWYSERVDDFPDLFVRAFEKVVDLPYGENPHQRAAYYAQVGARTHVLSMVSQVGGAELSFNNLLDLDSGRRLLREFAVPACVIVKHGTPCGTAVGETAGQAYEGAYACDPQSAYGGIVVLNRAVDAELATALSRQFVEVLFAPGYSEQALQVLAAKQRTRILEDQERRSDPIGERSFKQVTGGLLVQDSDVDLEERTEMQVVTERRPTDVEWSDLLFAWKVCKHVRSNAIVLARGLATVGIGAGQMSRVDSVDLAVRKARAGSTRDAVLASDAFFPFADSPRLAIDAGVSAIIQPGGSKRDHEVVEEADRGGLAMVFTARRHFKH